MRGGIKSYYRVVVPFQDVRGRHDHSGRLSRMLSKFDTVGVEIRPAEYRDKYRDEFGGDMGEQSWSSVVNDMFRIAVGDGVLEKSRTEGAIPEWFGRLGTVSYWASQLRVSRTKNSKSAGSRRSTSSVYVTILWGFNKWLSGRGLTVSRRVPAGADTYRMSREQVRLDTVEDLLDLARDCAPAPSPDVSRIIKEYLLDPVHSGVSPSTITTMRSAILSYFASNDLPITVHFKAGRVYAKSEEESATLALDGFVSMLVEGNASVTEKAVLLCKFHRGLDSATMADRFNFEALDQMRSHFKSEDHHLWDLNMCPVPITLTRIKTGYRHVGFLERDAVQSVCNYLDYAAAHEIPVDGGMFKNKDRRAVSADWIRVHFRKLALRCGIKCISRSDRRFSRGVTSHELRDLLKSTLIDCGCRIDVADHVIGHMPKDSYEKQSILYPDTMRREYAKAAGMLNVFTKMSNVLAGKDDPGRMLARLAEKEHQLERMLKDGTAEFAAGQRRSVDENARLSQLEDMMRRISALEGGLKPGAPPAGEPAGKGAALEFSCTGCGLIHSAESCPSCGSKIRRIYEASV